MFEVLKKDFKKLCDVVYRRCGISIDEKKYDKIIKTNKKEKK